MPRTLAVFRAWNKREIIILGGKDKNKDNLADGWVYDSTNDTMRQVIYPAANSLKIYSKDNQSYQSGESSVIAKVDFCSYTKYGSCIVEFDKDST